MFKSFQIDEGLEPHLLVQDVVTRWNSTEAMITSFLNLKVFF